MLLGSAVTNRSRITGRGQHTTLLMLLYCDSFKNVNFFHTKSRALRNTQAKTLAPTGNPNSITVPYADYR